MSKKDLARSAIERGRRPYNKYERRQSNTVERVKRKSQNKKFSDDPESAESAVRPVRTKVRKEFDDNLSAPLRFMEKQAGRRWDDVRSELFERFDTRTTAGRHILRDHLLSIERVYHYRFSDTVSRKQLYLSPGKTLTIGEDGILRVILNPRKRTKPERRTLSDQELVKWVGNRRIGLVGNVLLWFNNISVAECRTRRQYRANPLWRLGRSLQLIGATYKFVDAFIYPIAWRQHKALTKEDLIIFQKLNTWERSWVMIPSEEDLKRMREYS